MREAYSPQGNLLQAASDAPADAVCPQCGERVYLRRGRTGAWSYSHGRSAACAGKLGAQRVLPPATPLNLGDFTANLLAALAVAVARELRHGDSNMRLQAVLDWCHAPAVRLGLALTGESYMAQRMIKYLERWLTLAQDTSVAVVFSDDEGAVLSQSAARPGPIYDLRDTHNGYLAQLEARPNYIYLGPTPSVTDIMALPYVLVAVSRWGQGILYVLGEPALWERLQLEAYLLLGRERE